MSFAIINFVFAVPGFFKIDTFGRRHLLLLTFPFLALFQFLTGLVFLFRPGTAQTVLVLVGMCM